MKEEQMTIQSFIRTYFFQILGILALAGNLWMATQLSPVVRQLDLIDQRLQSLESQSAGANLLISRFIVVEEKTRALEEKLSRIEDKLDEINDTVNNR